MVVMVYHEVEPDFRGGRDVVDLTKFRLVGYVETRLTGEAALDAAFTRTQNLDRPWGENKSVRQIAGFCRSTSVGDVLEADGLFYEVENLGFKKVMPLDVEAVLVEKARALAAAQIVIDGLKSKILELNDEIVEIKQGRRYL